jgi:GNAT superfamily N-acetyltransferase
MVVLYSEHPARVHSVTRKQLAALCFSRERGYMREYITDRYRDIWELNDKVFWLEKGGTPFAWCIRSQTFPYESPCYMVYVKKAYRRKGWGSYLYRTATKYSRVRYDVYGSHDDVAAEYYEKLGREDYN